MHCPVFLGALAPTIGAFEFVSLFREEGGTLDSAVVRELIQFQSPFFHQRMRGPGLGLHNPVHAFYLLEVRIDYRAGEGEAEGGVEGQRVVGALCQESSLHFDVGDDAD